MIPLYDLSTPLKDLDRAASVSKRIPKPWVNGGSLTVAALRNSFFNRPMFRELTRS